VYFVTQDPTRDTPDVLRRWLDAFNPHFIGVVGSPGGVDSLAAAFDVPRAALARTSATDTTYTVGHASQVIVFTRDDQAHWVYPFGVRQESWTRDIPKLVAFDSTGRAH
jgi:protein SCO1/2